MDTINLPDLTKLITQEETLRRDVDRINFELAIEEQNLSISKMAHQSVISEIADSEKVLDSMAYYMKTMESMRETLVSMLMHGKFLAKFAEIQDPANLDLPKKAIDIKVSFDKMVDQYESNPTYLSILREETTESELRDLLSQKKIDIMKLQAELDV